MIETKPPYEVFVSEVFDTDVCEEIRVFPDYIQYNTRCWPCWIDYSKLEYKLEWGKLLVKAFEYAFVDCHLLKKFERWPRKKDAQIIIISTV